MKALLQSYGNPKCVEKCDSGHFTGTFQLVEDPEDFIHKAMRWMLRDIGKKDQSTLEISLAKHL